MATQVEQLRSRLLKAGHLENAFDLDGAELEDGFALRHEEGWWILRRFRAGAPHTLGSYEREGAACDALYAAMEAEWPVRRRLAARIEAILPRIEAAREPAIVHDRAWLVPELRRIQQELASGPLLPRPERDRGLGYTVIDQWPLPHPLGREIILIEHLYREA